jgi:hypothetical protein
MKRIALPQSYPGYRIVSPGRAPSRLATCAEVIAISSASERALSHSGRVRNVISTTSCNLSRLAPPAAWTAIP